MPSPQAAAVVLFWFQVISGIAAVIYIGQWMWYQAEKFGGDDMTSFPMKYPRLLLGLIAVSLLSGVFGLWNMFHLPKPIPYPVPVATSAVPAPSDPPDKIVSWAAPQTKKQKDRDQLQAKKLVLEYQAVHPGAVDAVHGSSTEKAELKWINKRLASNGIQFTLTSVRMNRTPVVSQPSSTVTRQGTAIIGAHGETNLDGVRVYGYGNNGIDLSPSEKATVKNTEVHKNDIPPHQPEEKK